MLITMSDKEIQRLAVLQDVRDQRITQVRGAEILNLSTRQITRLLQKLNQDGVSAMAHASVNGNLKLTPFTLKMAK